MVRGRNVQAVEPADEEDTGRVNPAVQGVQALTRGLALLDIVANSKRPLRFSEIADAAGLAKGTVHRMLAALVEARFLQLDSRTQTYRLGVRLFEMAHRVWNEFDLRGAAEPELERLRDVTGEAVRLAVLQGAEILYIDQREAMQAIRLANGVGGRAAAYATSAGKAILAHLDPAMRHRLLSTLELKRFTPNTITDAAELERELDLTVARGYAISAEEQTPGLHSVAAAILDHRSRPLGAICVLGPSFRLNVDKLHALGREVMEAARRVSGNAGQSLMSITIGAKPLGRGPRRCAGRVAVLGIPGRGADMVGQRTKALLGRYSRPRHSCQRPHHGGDRDGAHARVGRRDRSTAQGRVCRRDAGRLQERRPCDGQGFADRRAGGRPARQPLQ